MTDLRPGAGPLLAKYLLGLFFTLIGFATLLYGVYNNAGAPLWLGSGLLALGLFLVVLKIVARNRPPAP